MSCIMAMSAALKSLVEAGSFGAGLMSLIIFIMSSSCEAFGSPGISWPRGSGCPGQAGPGHSEAEQRGQCNRANVFMIVSLF